MGVQHSILKDVEGGECLSETCLLYKCWSSVFPGRYRAELSVTVFLREFAETDSEETRKFFENGIQVMQKRDSRQNSAHERRLDIATTSSSGDSGLPGQFCQCESVLSGDGACAAVGTCLRRVGTHRDSGRPLRAPPSSGLRPGQSGSLCRLLHLCFYKQAKSSCILSF